MVLNMGVVCVIEWLMILSMLVVVVCCFRFFWRLCVLVCIFLNSWMFLIVIIVWLVKVCNNCM